MCKVLIRSAFLVLSFLCLSCARPLAWTDPNQPENNGDGMTVLFSAADGSSKGGDPVGDPERSIGRWAVFAFDESNGWYRYSTSDSGEDIPMSLRAGRLYSCYAIVNYSTGGTGAFVPAQVVASAQLENKLAYLGDNAPGNLLMFGSRTVTPTEGAGDCSVSVRRLVSRINVSGIAVDFSDKPYLAEKTFTLRHVYITNAYRTTPYGRDFSSAELSQGRAAWYNSGGWHRGENGEPAMDALLGKRHLNTVITAASPFTQTLTFYAFPNPTEVQEDQHQLDSWTRRCTRIVIEATLGSETVYYQVDVPAMERNHVYTASNIIIRGRGSSDPEIIDIGPDSLDLSFQMDDGWDGTDNELNL